MKINSKLVYAIIGILFIWAILSFFGILSFISKAEYHSQESYTSDYEVGPDYVISVDFSSSGAFVVGKKVDVDVNILRGKGKKFVEGNNYIIIGDTTTYHYPQIEGSPGLYASGILDLELVDNGDKLIGSGSIYFNQQGEHEIYSNVVFSNEDGPIRTKSENKIPILGPESWLTIEQNNRLFSLTLIITALTLFLVFDQRKRY